MKRSKQQAEQFAKENPKIAAAVPNLRENPELLALGDRLEKLRGDLDDVRRSIATGRGKTDNHAAAEQLAAGRDIDVSPVKADVASLRQQQKTIEQAVAIVGEQYRLTHAALIRDFCRNFETTAQKFVATVLSSMEATLVGIAELDALFTFLSVKGYKTDGDKFCLPWALRSMLRGGPIPELSSFIGEQKELWGLSGKKK